MRASPTFLETILGYYPRGPLFKYTPLDDAS